jgi:hypothetical protein
MILFRIQLLEVRINEPLLSHLNEGTIGAGNEVSFVIERAVVGLLDKLDCEGDVSRGRRHLRGDSAAFFGIASPSHESLELGLVGQDTVLITLNAGTTKDGRHD